VGAGEGANKPGDVVSPLQRQRGELKASNPPFRPLFERRDIVGR
jgi:hypothetical protein